MVRPKTKGRKKRHFKETYYKQRECSKNRKKDTKAKGGENLGGKSVRKFNAIGRGNAPKKSKTGKGDHSQSPQKGKGSGQNKRCRTK